MNEMKEEEFFIGWQGKAPEGIGRFVRGRAWALLAIGLALAILVAALQGTIGRAWFEAGNARDFQGILLKEPVPMLIADRPHEASGASVYYLVNPLKFGFDAATAEKFHLRNVALKGKMIWRADGQAMIEVVPGSVAGRGDAGDSPLGEPVSLGEIAVRGEIIDSKCYLGVMNPGRLKGHRACAIRCISGGIPPILLVEDGAGAANCFLLLGEDGAPVNAEVLDFVALPVEITGRAFKHGDRLVLKASPSTYRLLE